MVWREARRAGAEAVMVFEDDVVLCRGFRERWEALILPDDWQILYFGCVFREAPEEVSPGLLRVRGRTWDMHGYVIRRELWGEVSRELGGLSSAAARDAGGPRPLADGWWDLPPRERGRLRARHSPQKEVACDVVLADYHRRVGAYAVWPPMAWQVEGLSNNEGCVRGNYRGNGEQRIYRQAIAHLPGVTRDVGLAKSSGSSSSSKMKRSAVVSPVMGAPGTAQADEVGEEPARMPRRDSVISACEFSAAPVQEARQTKGGTRGILVAPYSSASERMAYGLVCSLRLYNPTIPVCVLGQDYLCSLAWKGLAEVKHVRADGAHGSDEQWFNKLGALLKSPYDETIFLDCDIVLLTDPGPWFAHLGTDDFTCFHQNLSVEMMPRGTTLNVVNVHEMEAEYRIRETPVIDGGGHFFLRNTERGRRLVHATMDIMADALDLGPASLYHRMAGPQNCAASDEIAFSIAAVVQEIRLPEPLPKAHRPIAMFLPPHQRDEKIDLAAGKVAFFDTWCGETVRPGAIHFASTSKRRPEYQAWLERCEQYRWPGVIRVASRAGKRLRTRRFLFDLGFHHGEGLRYLWGRYEVDATWSVFAFEPNSACHATFFGEDGEGVPCRYVALPMAVHDAAGPAVFQREKAEVGESGMGSHLTGIGFELDPRGAGQEEVWKIDFPLFLRALIPLGREQSYVVVKMDIEGAEYAILRAMLADGSIGLVDVLHVEFHQRLMPAESDESTEALREQLRQHVELVEHW
jgi:FkbM family methyltransferase